MIKNINQAPLKPLEDYLNEIKKRNKNLTQISPMVRQLYNNISTYDDLYHKLIEETYYIYNELQIQSYKAKSLNKIENNKELADDTLLKKTLDFKTLNTEVTQRKKSNDNINTILKPIAAPMKKKSNFYKTRNMKKKGTATKSQQKAFNRGDMIFLLNNSKAIENLLLSTPNQPNPLENNSVGCILSTNQSNEDIISIYDKKILEIEKEKKHLLDHKVAIEKELNDLKCLLTQFDLKYSSIADLHVNSELQEEGKESAAIDSQASEKINDLFTKKLYKEANEHWKVFNYQPLLNIPIDRSYEILNLFTQLKDRQIQSFKQNIQMIINRDHDAQKRNKEINEALANIKLCKTKVKENESSLTDLKNKLSLMRDDNSILFQENRKLKTLIEINSKLS